MFVPDERLLYLHVEHGASTMVIRLQDDDADPPIGCTGEIEYYHFRVIRRAEVEPCPDGNTYWVIHALEIPACYN